jgi:tetratricopeptide (TPR) repeat protein
MRLEPRCLPALALAVASCATVPSVADRDYRSGDYAAAAAAYEEALRADPKAHDNPALCLRLGLSYARPGTSAHDPRRAAAVLRDLVTRFPKTREARQAVALIPQLDYEAALEAAATAASARILDLQDALTMLKAEARTLDAAVKAGSEQVQRLRALLAEREAQLRRVRDELEQLKRIDLQRAP